MMLHSEIDIEAVSKECWRKAGDQYNNSRFGAMGFSTEPTAFCILAAGIVRSGQYSETRQVESAKAAVLWATQARIKMIKRIGPQGTAHSCRDP